VFFNGVVNKLHDKDGFPDTGPPEHSGLSSPWKRRKEIHDLDSGFKHFTVDDLRLYRRRRPVYLPRFRRFYASLVVDRLSCDVEHPAKGLFPYRHFERGPGVLNRHATH